MAFIPTTHLIQDRAHGVAATIWLGALISAGALAPTLFLSSRPAYTVVFYPWRFDGSIRPLCDDAG